MRSSLLLAALLGLACASEDDSRERMIEEASPVLRDIQDTIVATMHLEEETPIDLEESFSGSLTVGGFGGPSLSGGVGSPTLGGGVGSPELTGGVAGVDVGGVAPLPSSAGGVDLNFVDAVCDLFSGVCQWVVMCSEQPTDAELCDVFFFGSQCRSFITEVMVQAGIPSVPADVTSAIRCLADEFPTLSCFTDGSELYPLCIPGYVPPPDFTGAAIRL